MAITFPGQQLTEDSATITSKALLYPTGCQAGETLLCIFVAAVGAITPPGGGGWTSYDSFAHDTNNVYIFTRAATGSESGSTGAFTFASGKMSSVMIRVAGLDAAIWDAAIVKGTAATTVPFVCPSITTVTDNAVVVGVFTGNSASAVTTKPTAMTEDFQNQKSPSTKQLVVAHLTKTPAGATGTQSWSWTQSGLQQNACNIALRPSTAVAAPKKSKNLNQAVNRASYY